jgi:signal transduction histidine kinase/CheY-like chemotaxis protein/HPt (histidine-containing phosphotransfer) domain-containing protein
MPRRRSLTVLVLGLFAGIAGLVALVFVIQLIELVALRDDTVSSRSATDLLTASYSAELSVLDMETGLRGFLLTRERRFLQPYNEAKGMIGPQLSRLAALTSGTAQGRDVMAISRAVDSYVRTYTLPLIATGGRLSKAQTALVTARGKQSVDRIRRMFSALNAVELTARSRRRASLDSQTTTTIVIAAAGLAISVLLLVAFAAYLLRNVLRPVRDVSAALERRAAGDLSVRVPEGGRGEVGQLQASFNQMAETLERRTRELSEANTRLESAVAAAEEASRMKSEFLANMSHEIRTPLNGVLGMVTLLANTPLSAEQREYVELAKASSDALINIVSDILDVSKIEAGRMELELQDFYLHELVAASRDMLGREAFAKGLELRTRIDEDVPLAVRGDRFRVGQVLTNLLSNAVKFTAAGSVELDVAVAERTNVANMICFRVRDTGIGIEHDRLAALFDPFTQADFSTTRQYGGTGLGLTICRDLARMMGGEIRAESELGKGSTFEVTIPLAPALGDVVAPVPSVELRGLRVLVVDDNAANRRIVEAYVASWGMRSSTARDASDAVDKLAAAADGGEPFDVALLDFNMPGENGLELARRIGTAPRLRSTRLILLSSTSASMAQLQANGVSRQLTKPISQSSLLDAIAAVMHSALVSAGAIPVNAPAGPDAQARPVAAVKPARILIAEDNVISRTYVERLLRSYGHDIACAADGREVLELTAEQPFDLILMDCQMPAVDGYDATRELRRREAASGDARTAIVAMTASATEEIRQHCIDAGMDDYLSKPLLDTELRSALARWLPQPREAALDPAQLAGGRGGGGAASAGRDARPDPALADGVLDQARLERLRSLFPGDEANEVLARLVLEVQSDLERVDRFLRTEQFVEAAGAAHNIRGSAQLVGASRLAQTAGILEKSGHAADPSPATLAADAEALRTVWASTRRSLEVLLDSERREYHPHD